MQLSPQYILKLTQAAYDGQAHQNIPAELPADDLPSTEYAILLSPFSDPPCYLRLLPRISTYLSSCVNDTASAATYVRAAADKTFFAPTSSLPYKRLFVSMHCNALLLASNSVGNVIS